MASSKTIVVFDIGKTNKKMFLFDEDYRIVFEKTVQINEMVDEDGFPCEDIYAVRSFIVDSLREISKSEEFDIRAINFSTYGASFVMVDEFNEPLGCLYNYLKPYPSGMSQELYDRYGGEEAFSLQTASPALGSLNSGLQLYRLKQQNAEKFERAKYALHLPQFASAILTKKFFSDITSIGCHTALWNFSGDSYHQWVYEEGIANKLAPLVASNTSLLAELDSKKMQVGVGLHDSSAALIPYLLHFTEPFLLISTGTWCISLNPFNDHALTAEELKQDCLCYYSFEAKPVKASRLFAGNEHELQVRRLAEHFHFSLNHYKGIEFNRSLINGLPEHIIDFNDQDLYQFKSYEQAYHALMWNIVKQQERSTKLILTNNIRRLFVDGGFGQNKLYMTMLAEIFPGLEVYAASMPQATALGAALAIHKEWNSKPLRNDLIELKYFSDRKQPLNI